MTPQPAPAERHGLDDRSRLGANRARSSHRFTAAAQAVRALDFGDATRFARTPHEVPRSGAFRAALLALLVLVAASCAGAADPAPLVRAEIGFALGGGVHDLSESELQAQLDAVADAGAGWIRIDLAWSAIEAEQGVFDWADTDFVVEEASERGLWVLAIVAYTPSWARPAATTDKHPPDDMEAFGAFVRAAGERYRDVIKHWEIWNEPNHAPFWEGGVDPALYADMVNVAADQLLDEVPGVYIVSGGLSPAVDNSPSMSPETFIDRFLPLVGDGLLDAVGLHPYSFPAHPTGGEGWNTFGRIPDIKTKIDGIEPGLALWFTEFGAPTNVVSREQQAADIVEAIDCAEKWPWAGPLFIFTWTDWTEESFGVVTQDGTPKPAIDDIRRLTSGASDPSRCDLG